jgi:hypothetical protein
MTKKADFNAEEWSIVAEGPLLAGMRVVTASGGGKIRESLAMAKTYAKAREQHGESELLDALVATPPSVDAERARESGDLVRASSERLTQALEILGAKATPDEIEAYKRFVLTMGEAAANAHKEGGFLGAGGKRVSDEEQAALDDIAATMGIDRKSPGEA